MRNRKWDAVATIEFIESSTKRILNESHKHFFDLKGTPDRTFVGNRPDVEGLITNMNKDFVPKTCYVAVDIRKYRKRGLIKTHIPSQIKKYEQLSMSHTLTFVAKTSVDFLYRCFNVDSDISRDNIYSKAYDSMHESVSETSAKHIVPPEMFRDYSKSYFSDGREGVLKFWE